MENSLDVLGLEHLWVVYPGDKSYPVHEKISVCPLLKISYINNIIKSNGVGL
jgi:hypothetical protein